MPALYCSNPQAAAPRPVRAGRCRSGGPTFPGRGAARTVRARFRGFRRRSLAPAPRDPSRADRDIIGHQYAGDGRIGVAEGSEAAAAGAAGLDGDRLRRRRAQASRQRTGRRRLPDQTSGFRPVEAAAHPADAAGFLKTMAGNSFGTRFRFRAWGESHGPAIGVVVDGVPPRLPLAEPDIQHWLDKRKPGQSLYTTQRREADLGRIMSGTFDGVTTGAPIQLLIENTDQP